MTGTSRRSFIRHVSGFAISPRAIALLPATGSAVGTPRAAQGGLATVVIDTHIHLYDPRRRGGVPWPERTNRILYRPALPARYRHVSAPFGVVGAIAIECSPLAADNDWLLQTAKLDPLIVGVVGDLDPGLPQFSSQLERLRQDPLFRGIRYGNLWGRDLGAQLNDTTFIDNLKLLARSQLLLESANPDPALIANLLHLTALIPDLRIVIDHLPQAIPSGDSISRDMYLRDLRGLSLRANVFVKGSEILRLTDGTASRQLVGYRDWLDEIWDIFGEDRLIFGSDWPNSDQTASLADTFSIAQQYLATRGSNAAEKFFWRNSLQAYGWRPRDAAQARLATS